MTKRATTEEFIAKARQIHGDRYDYSKCEYRGSKLPVIIVCREHGPFSQVPSKHTCSRHGCPRCGGSERKTTARFISEATAVHGAKYDYSQVSYTNAYTHVRITCPEHGEFLQTPHMHLNGGRGCPQCGGSASGTTDDFARRAREVHGSRYDYGQVIYVNNKAYVTILCPEHGPFQQIPKIHLKGSGCPKCAPNCKKPELDILRSFEVVHGDKYGYPATITGPMNRKIEITCPVHGPFLQAPSVHAKGHGCPQCGDDAVAARASLTFEEFLDKAKRIHGDRYSYLAGSYTGYREKVDIICPTHGLFSQEAYGHAYGGHGCPSCACIRSKAEQEIADAVAEFYGGEIRRNDRSIIAPFELDIALPGAGIAVEYCGLRWHSEHFGGKEKGFHLQKTVRCASVGYELLTIFEDEWKHKREVVLDVLRYRLGAAKIGFYARALRVSSISWPRAAQFLDAHHLQGRGSPASARYGAFRGGDLVAVMTFGAGRAALASATKGLTEMLRFCTDGRVHPGVAGRLFSAFVREHRPDTVVSYADRRWFTGKLYSTLGFHEDGHSPPSYWYVKNPDARRHHRYAFRKQKVLDMGGVPDLSEWENMKAMGWDRIWDCGTTRFVWGPGTESQNGGKYQRYNSQTQRT